ncbi:MAG: LON peptidase substrate-binding domain-containing protein [Solirubrobacterales bacterium]|nr:LON peptidase substrate-binding domain-containing protein [Solirubrobacterales bacterium]
MAGVVQPVQLGEARVVRDRRDAERPVDLGVLDQAAAVQRGDERGGVAGRPDDPGAEDLHPVGAAARVLKALKHSSGNYSLILQGLVRVRLDGVTQQGPYLKAKIRRLEGKKKRGVVKSLRQGRPSAD